MKSDIWSLGCVLYECTTLKPPFVADDMAGLYKKVLKGVYPKIPPIFSNDLANMIKILLHVSPLSRPTCGILIIRKNTQNTNNSEKNRVLLPRRGHNG